ncbi:MAG: hypothetical protein ACRER2_03050 [Methylococcales bacterium]
MDNSFIDTWQESTKTFAGFLTTISDKNIALTQQLYSDIASKQFTKMTEVAFQMGCGMKNAGQTSFFDGSIYTVPSKMLSESYIKSVKELNEIFVAGYGKIYASQISVWKSYIDLLSGYCDNLNRSRGVDDVVATNFDYLSDLMKTAKSGALDGLVVGASIKTALVAWSDNSVQALEEEVEAIVEH